MNKSITSENITNLKRQIDYVSSMIEVTANSCIYNEYFSEYDILKSVLQQIYNIYETIDNFDLELNNNFGLSERTVDELL